MMNRITQTKDSAEDVACVMRATADLLEEEAGAA